MKTGMMWIVYDCISLHHRDCEGRKKIKLAKWRKILKFSSISFFRRKLITVNRFMFITFYIVAGRGQYITGKIKDTREMTFEGKCGMVRNIIVSFHLTSQRQVFLTHFLLLGRVLPLTAPREYDSAYYKWNIAPGKVLAAISCRLQFSFLPLIFFLCFVVTLAFHLFCSVNSLLLSTISLPHTLYVLKT